jgi:DNA-binding NarL/FixJ family response regulator
LAKLEELMEQVRVSVRALDPITQAGLTNCLEPGPGVTVTSSSERDQVDVVVAAFDRLTTAAVALLRTVAAEVARPVVLVVGEIREVELRTAVECQVVAILPREAATDERLVRSVHAAAEGGPANLLGQLAAHTERLHQEVLAPNGLTAASLSPREITVLRMMADGLDTGEIAGRLRYSERTVKNIIYTITNRLHLRNRSHAVAYAVRAGVI